MSDARRIRRADKTVSDWGKWQSGGMGTAFPLSKRRQRFYRLGAAYRWRIVRFTAEGFTFRLLVAFNIAKEQYRAVLGLEHERDMSVLASYEFHGTHPGWHLHGSCGDIEIIPQGSMRGEW